MPPKAKPDTAAYQKLKKDIKEGTIGTLYVFHGEEAYLRDFYLGQLKKKLLPAGMEEFNLHTLSGKEFDVKTLAQLVDCLPMMSERTLIVVNDYDIYKGDKDALAAVLRELPDYVCLVFVYDLIEYKADARTKLAALLKEKGSVVPFNRQGQGDLVDWISRRFKAMDHDIGTEDAKYLIFLCGDLMNNLISEIGKIGSYAAHHRVTRQDIDAVATPQLDAVVFQMTDAIGGGAGGAAPHAGGPHQAAGGAGQAAPPALHRPPGHRAQKGRALPHGAVGHALGLPGGAAHAVRPALFPALVPPGGAPLRPDRSGHEVHRGGRRGAADRPAHGAGRQERSVSK